MEELCDMRLINWGILFMFLFIGIGIRPFIKTLYEDNAMITMEQYNRNIDRAVEDALLDQIVEEKEDSSISLDSEKIYQAFLNQLYFVFNAGTEYEKTQLEKLLLIQKVVNQTESLSIEQQETLAKEMEQIINDNSSLTEYGYALFFPIIEGESWHQKLSNNSFYTFVELNDVKRYGWVQRITEREAVRYSFSGAKIRKKN